MARFNIAALHNKIRSRFNVKSRSHGMPLLARVGGRDELANFLADEGYHKGAEIGVNKGYYSETLCKANPNIELYCVDAWYNQRAKKLATARLKPYNATMIHKLSLDAVNDFPDQSLDFVYIDASHYFDDFVCDLVYWSKKVRKYGIIGCHDYFHHSYNGVVGAIDAYTNCHNIYPWYVTLELWPSAFWVKNYR